jgi:hypothetical protein
MKLPRNQAMNTANHAMKNFLFMTVPLKFPATRRRSADRVDRSRLSSWLLLHAWLVQANAAIRTEIQPLLLSPMYTDEHCHLPKARRALGTLHPLHREEGSQKHHKAQNAEKGLGCFAVAHERGRKNQQPAGSADCQAQPHAALHATTIRVVHRSVPLRVGFGLQVSPAHGII